MKRIGIVCLCLIAASGAGAALAASAAAELPEYVSCQRLAGGGKGRYESKSCSEESAGGEGKYELLRGFGKDANFSSRAGRSRLESVEVPEAMECKTTHLSGELTGSKDEQNIIVTFAGCEAAGSKCNSAGAKAGVIVTSALKGELGYLAGKGTPTPSVGVLLTQQEAPEAAEFSCEGLAARVHGPLIAEVTGNINTLSAESVYSFRETSGLPQYTSFEGGTFLEDAWRWEFNTGRGFEPEGGQVAGLELHAGVTSTAVEVRA